MQIPPTKVSFSPEDREEILRRIDRALASGKVSQGENVEEFEERFARYVGARNAVAVSSGGAAIEVAMQLCNVKGKEVLVPTNTFAATATGVIRAGGKIRFAEAASDTFGVSLATLENARTNRTVGVIVTHIGGIISPEMPAIRAWCDREGYWLFEDAAHAHGSSLHGTMAGRFGRAAAYSFFGTKVITSGEGGMLVTDDEGLAKGARRLRDYGKPEPWVSVHTELGANWRMSEFCGAVGLVHLGRLEEFITRREVVAALYTGVLSANPELVPVLPAGRSSWYKYIVLLPEGIDREKLKANLKEKGVSLSGGVYDIPLHRQPIFQGTRGVFPVADDICTRHVCLPIHAEMTEEEARYAAKSFLECLPKEPGEACGAR